MDLPSVGIEMCVGAALQWSDTQNNGACPGQRTNTPRARLLKYRLTLKVLFTASAEKLLS